jgi:hypothetical protein
VAPCKPYEGLKAGGWGRPPRPLPAGQPGAAAWWGKKCIGDMLSAPDMCLPNICPDLGDDSELPLLARSRRWQNPVHGMHQGLMVSPKLEGCLSERN